MGHKELNVIYKSDVSKASNLMIILFRDGVDVCHHATEISWLTPFLERNDNGTYEEAWVYDIHDYYANHKGWVVKRDSDEYSAFAIKEEARRKANTVTKTRKARTRMSAEDLSDKEKLKREKRKLRRLARKARLKNG